MEKKEYDSLNLKCNYLLNNLIESNAFDKIKLFQVDVVELLKKRIQEISLK